jgi:hypothetical protein
MVATHQQGQQVVIKPLLKRFSPLYQCKGLRNVVLVGGRYSAKSWAIAQAIVYHTSKYKVRVLCTRSVQKSIEKSSKQVILDQIRRLGLQDAYHVTREGITHKTTGSEIWFIGLHDLDSIRSLEGIQLVWVEEAQSETEEMDDVLGPTIRANNAVIFYSMNPIYETDWASKTFLGTNTPPDTVVIRVNYNDLPEGIISPQILKLIEHDKSTNFAKYKHKYLGEFADNSTGTLIPMAELREAMARPILTQARSGKRVIGIDIGGGGDPSVICIYRDGMVPQFTRFDLDDPQALGNALAKVIRTQPVGTPIALDGGGIGWGIPAVLDTLLSKTYPITSVKFGSSPVNSAAKALNRRSEMYMRLSEAIRGTLCLNGAPGDLIQELSVIKCWETNSGLLQLDDKGDIAKTIGKSSLDYADALALCYAISPVDPDNQRTYRRPPSSQTTGSWMD